MSNGKTVLSHLPELIQTNVICVTVTYGDRRHLLTQVLDSLSAQGLRKVAVVDNGAKWPVRAALVEAYGDFVDVVEMGRNVGSAPGYGAGIQRAMDLGADFIWLLDDDNWPQANALSKLLERHRELMLTTDPSLLAVTAFRGLGQSGIASRHLTPRHSSYLGFHVSDIPRKMLKRIPGLGIFQRHDLPAVVSIDIAPYGGIFFSRAVVERVGLPCKDFVLYCDDYEWSLRITRSGGRIELVSHAIVNDLQRTQGSAHSNHPTALLQCNADAVAYYMARNEAYFYKTLWCENRPIYLLNKLIFSVLLWFVAKATRRDSRYKLLCRAMHEGSAGKIGFNPAFPL